MLISNPRTGVVTIFLARHGKTLFNAAHRAQGWCDAPLTADGVEGARALGAKLSAAGVRFDAAYAGDLGRQRATARLILEAAGQESLPLQTENGLKECGFGRWEGENESIRDEAFALHLGLPSGSKPYGVGLRRLCQTYVETDDTGLAEDLDTACNRMMAGLRRIAEEALAKGQKNVLAVTSGMITMALVFEVLGVPRSDAPGGIPTASCTILEYENGALRVIPPVGRLEF